MSKVNTTTNKGKGTTQKSAKKTTNKRIAKLNNNVVKFVLSVDKTHKGSGLPVLFGTLGQMAKKSTMYVCGRGAGKTTTIDAIPDIGNIVSETQRWDNGVATTVAKEHLGHVRDAHIQVKMPEFSTFPSGHRDFVLTTVSAIITDREHYRLVRASNKGDLSIDVKNTDLTCQVAIQPILFSKMSTQNSMWESLSKDRFVKFMLVNPVRVGQNDEDEINVEMPKVQPIETIKYDESKLDVYDLKMMFIRQTSMGRASSYTKNFLKAYASFCGHKKVTQKHVKEFTQLFGFYLNCFNDFVSQKDLDSPEQIASGEMVLLTNILATKHEFGNATKKLLCEILNVSGKGIEKYQTNLVAKEYINTKFIGKGKNRTVEFVYGKKIQDFVTWYNKTFK